MKIACGTDIIEIDRIKKTIERTGERFLKKVYTENEIRYCKSHGKNMYQHFAVRFAAKEAVFKAISKITKGDNTNILHWQDFEIVNEENGKPKLLLRRNNNFEDIDITLSHCKEYATATVVILY